jgi:hypothetical protein
MRCECCVDVGHDLEDLGKRWWRKHSDRNYASVCLHSKKRSSRCSASSSNKRLITQSRLRVLPKLLPKLLQTLLQDPKLLQTLLQDSSYHFVNSSTLHQLATYQKPQRLNMLPLTKQSTLLPKTSLNLRAASISQFESQENPVRSIKRSQIYCVITLGAFQT